MKTKQIIITAALLVLSSALTLATPLGTAFTYQGRLDDGVNPANGSYDLQFTLFDTNSGGTVVAGPLTNAAVAVSNGLFTVALDFGAGVITVEARWLEMGVRSNGSGADFTILSPLQELTPTPYALYAPSAGTAALALNVSPSADITGARLNIGSGNTVNGTSSTIAGGQLNVVEAGATLSAIGGGQGNAILTNASFSAIGGGQWNIIWTNAVGSTIAGGLNNSVAVDATLGAIGGGQWNKVESTQSTIGGGGGNVIFGGGGFDTIAGGTGNAISNGTWSSTIAGGQNNTVQPSANYSAIPGGINNSVAGWCSFAAGNRAKANHHGSFVWADSTDADFASTGNNQFLIRASGGVGIGTTTPAAKLDVAGTVTAYGINPPPAAVMPVLGMVWIQPGTFLLGSRADEPGRSSIEGPQTVVTLTRGFWMGVHEVTQGEYTSVMASNPSHFTAANGHGDDPNRPVEQVTWDNATNYCGLLTTAERTAGRIPSTWAYRLPTEAEWEYSCRAGARTTRFGYGDDISDAALGNYAWYSFNNSSTTHPVEQKLANPWGLMDMHGNVWEWCQDWHGTYPGGSETDPQGPGTGSDRAARGGCWYDFASFCRSAFRYHFNPAGARDSLGFRVVLAPGQ